MGTMQNEMETAIQGLRFRVWGQFGVELFIEQFLEVHETSGGSGLST